MSASYLLDEDPSEDEALTKVDIQQGTEDDAEAYIVHSLRDESDHKSFCNSKSIQNAPLGYGYIDFPSTARFVPVNVPSSVLPSTSRKFPLPRANATDGMAHSITDIPELRSLILTASESICKRSSKKRMAVTAPAAARRRKCNIGNKKESTVITVAEDPVAYQSQSTRISGLAETRDLPPQNVRPTTVLVQLSEKTLNKLHAFKFPSHVDCVAPPPKSLDHRPDCNTPASEEIPCLQPDVPAASNEDTYDEFEFDETIFDNIYINDDADCQTPDSSMLGVNNSTIDPCPGELESDRATDPKVPPQPHSSPGQSKTLPNPTQTPPIPMSPFLRLNFPQPAPSQFTIPSLIPHRRIPTVFRIAEVHRLLATLSSNAPPQRIELYAAVACSRRALHANTQEFTFADLFFPHRPPYLCGTYTAWKLCELFNEDSAPFLGTAGESRLCRAIVQVTKNSLNGNVCPDRPSPLPMPGGGKGGWKEADALDVEVLNIWEATWEDVEYVKGIVEA